MAFDPDRSVLAIGAVFHGRYEVVRCLKHGGMGAIYEVIHIETRRRRALKLMLPGIVTNADMHARFKLEATVAADIESEHIVETFDAGVDKETGVPFLVMELLRGEDLDAFSSQRGALPATEVVTMLSQTASALDKTHAAGVVHRDLKPENLFLARRDDGSPKIKILDFGIAKVVSESGQPAAKTKVLGTPLYMSPEQIRGDGTIGPRADLYALTHIALTLLVGHPFWADEAQGDQLYAMMMKIVAGSDVAATVMAAKHGVTLPPAFDAWFKKGTSVVPQERFATASELVEALADVLEVPVRLSTVGAPVPVAVGRSLASRTDLAARSESNSVPAATAPIPAAATRVVPGESSLGVGSLSRNGVSSSTAGSLGPGSVSQAMPPAPMKRSRAGVVVAAVIGLAIVGVLGVWILGRSDRDDARHAAQSPLSAAASIASPAPQASEPTPAATPSPPPPAVTPSPPPPTPPEDETAAATTEPSADRAAKTARPLGGTPAHPAATHAVKGLVPPPATRTRSLD